MAVTVTIPLWLWGITIVTLGYACISALSIHSTLLYEGATTPKTAVGGYVPLPFGYLEMATFIAGIAAFALLFVYLFRGIGEG